MVAAAGGGATPDASPRIQEASEKSAAGAAADEAYAASVRAFIDTRVQACCAAAGVSTKSAGIDGAAAASEAAAAPGLLPMPAGATDEDLELTWEALELSMKTVRCANEGRRAGWWPQADTGVG